VQLIQQTEHGEWRKTYAARATSSSPGHRPQTREEMQEMYGPWGNRDATSMFKEVGDSAETGHDNDMCVTSKMANRWKEIQWL
jgi:hypothetical protein